MSKTEIAPATRQALHDRAWALALAAVQEARPPGTDREYWDKPCTGCGEALEMPGAWDKPGPLCKCEWAASLRARQEYIEQHRDAVADEIWYGSGVVRRFEDAVLTNFDRLPGTERALDVCTEWARRFDFGVTDGICLSGGFGSGKTHLLTATLRSCVDLHLVDAHWVSAPSLVMAVRRGQYLDWEPVERALEAEVTLLDDIGAEGGGDIGREIVQRVIMGRYDESKPLLTSTNLGPRALSDALGSAVTSRLLEMTEAVHVKAADYRRRGRRGMAAV